MSSQITLTEEEKKWLMNQLEIIKKIHPNQYKRIMKTIATLKNKNLHVARIFTKNLIPIIGFISRFHQRRNTSKSYLNVLVIFNSYITVTFKKHIMEIGNRELEAYFNYAKEKYSNNTLVLHRDVLRAFYRYNDKVEMAKKVGQWKFIKEHKFKVDLTYEEIMRILENVDDARVRLAVLFIAFSGMRPSEALGICWGDIEETEDMALANIKYRPSIKYGAKGKSGERTVPISKEAIIVLSYLKQKYIEKYHTLPSQGQRIIDLSYTMLRKKFLRAVNRAGIKNKQYPITLHKLRHFFGHYWMDKVRDIVKLKEIMGHSDIKTTLIYTKPTKEEIIQKYKELNG